MQLTFDPALQELLSQLGWGARSVGHELIIGDYADGYRLMQRDEYVHLARRSQRGEPSLKMWSPDTFWLQVYVAYWAARELRIRRGHGLRRAQVTGSVGDERRIEVGGDGKVYLVEQATGRWAGFGVGNDWAAIAFANALRPTIAEVIEAVLEEDKLPLLTCRDSRAGAEHFGAVQATAEKSCASQERRIAKELPPQAPPFTRALDAGNIVGTYWNAFAAAYSAGESRAQLRSRFETILSAHERELRMGMDTIPHGMFLKRFSPVHVIHYQKTLWLVSVAIALEVEEAVFDRVLASIDYGWHDRLIDAMIATRRPDHPIAAELAQRRRLRLLGEAIDAPRERQQQLVQRHASKWETVWRDAPGWGDHTVLPQLYYHGYWSFESVGFVKAFGLDDAQFRNDEYYPGDLLQRDD